MELRHLKLIQIVAGEGSLTKAARRLFVTQSALSHQLREIENELGTPLFTRTRNGMVLTPAGARLQQAADRVVVELQRAEKEIQRDADDESGVLRVATQCYTCYHWLPPLLKKFSAEYPRVVVSIVPEYTHHALEGLEKGALDVAIVSTPVADRRQFASSKLLEDELVAVLHPDHPLARRSYLRPVDFADINLLVQDLPGSRNDFVHDFLAKTKITPRQVSHVPLTEALIQMAQAGFGVAVLTRWAVEPYLHPERLVARPITRKRVTRCWRAVSNRGAFVPTYVTRFIEWAAKTGLRGDLA